ncbi:DUF177 domain-containing protein [Rhodobacter sp. Har01]|uniref:YceD family protein n=1 Tax=Rhodobacter sp. Har01 TaxID=2883999 RepID=UPI001D067536|nr:YceD family protein [Rhodobacter sp. Har01]MCB6177034.1 DUF177 domain-containing protein [Rhodobacter sp. Har01]
MTDDAPTFRTGALSHRHPTPVRWTADAPALAALAMTLDLPGIDALAFDGAFAPEGRDDFRLEGRLTARLTQSCVVTLAPVPARIDEPVLRRYLADYADPQAEEAEMPDDDTVEPLPAFIDLAAVVAEALALALPPYPRAPGADLGEAVFAPPGVEPLREADLRPFAALAALKPKAPEGGGSDAG